MSDMASCLWNTRDRQTNIFNICCISWGLCRGCPWDLENCILIMPMFVCDVVDLCVMFSLICMSSGKKIVGWWLFCGGGVFHAVGGRSIGCQIGRTSPWSCFRGWGVAPSCFEQNTKRGASSPGYCGWCADTFQPELVACSRAAQIVDESLGDFHGGWVQQKKNGIMVPMFFWRTALNIQMLICTLDVCKIAGIGKPISSRCVVFLGVSVCKMMQDNARWCKILQDDARQCKMIGDFVRWCKTMQDGARGCKMVQDDARQCKMMQDNARQCKMMQDDERWCKSMQDDARWCKAMQGDAIWCKMMQDKAIWLKVVQDDARWCVISKIKRNDACYTHHHGTELFLRHLRGIFHDKMEYNVSYTASWYRAVLFPLCGNFHVKMKWHVIHGIMFVKYQGSTNRDPQHLLHFLRFL